MGWLTGPKQDDAASKDALALLDGRQGFMALDPFGTRVNEAGQIFPDGSYSNYVRNGYGRNELVYSCIRYRAESLPLATIQVYPQDDAVPIRDHRLRRLFENPNPVTGEFELFELSSTYKDLAGIAYFLVVNGRDGLPTELWPLPPNLVTVLPNPRNLADYTWIYRPDPTNPQVAVPIPDAGSPRAARSPAFVVRVRYPNPNTDDPGYRYFGQPPLRAAARATSLDNAATDHVDTLLRNHAMPGVLIETENVITDTIHKRLRALWKQAFGGRNLGEPAFLQKGMKVHELGMSLKDMEFPDLRGVSETRICMAFGVEPILVGVKSALEHNAYRDYREARLSFWEESMLSEQRRFIEPVRSFLVPRFTGVGRRPIRVDWDLSGVPALKEAQGALWTRATDALARGGITRNDFRDLVGLPRVAGGDVFLTPSGVPEDATGERAAAEAASASAKVGLLAAEYGIELSADELSVLTARTRLEG